MQSSLVSAIYEAPLAERPWTALLPKLRHETRAAGLMLKFSAGKSDGSEVVFADAEWDYGSSLEQYEHVYRYKDPVRYSNTSVGGFYRFEDLIDRSALYGTEFYKSFCRPFDIHHAFFFYIGKFNGLDTWLNGSRTSMQEPFSASEMQTLRALLPHLSRAAQYYARLEQQRAESLIYSQTVSALGVGVALLDCDGRIIGTNAQADDIFAGSSPIRQVEGRLQLAGSAQREFTAAVTRLASSRATPVQAVGATDGSGRRLNLVARRADSLTGCASIAAPSIVVYIGQDAQDLQSSMVAVVARALGLSPAEARFALLLANGHGLSEIARRLAVTETTARTYCKRALAKTGAQRQTELVRLVGRSLAQLA